MRATLTGAAVAGALLCGAGAPSPSRTTRPERVRLVDVSRATAALVPESKKQGYTGIAVHLSSREDMSRVVRLQPVVNRAGLRSYVWVSVGRDPAAAEAHPEWLHVPQHHEWLEGKQGRHGVYPWVCVNNRQVFDYQRLRLIRLLGDLRGVDGVFLTDIQGPPVGCGCGNTLCRSWDNSPGEKIAQSPYTNRASFFSLIFTAEIRRSLPRLLVIPVLAPECEVGVTVGGARDPDTQTGACRGIPCNTCGEHFYPRLAAAAEREPAVGLLCLYQAFGRDLPLYGGQPAAWVGGNVARFREHNRRAPLFAVVQGWNVTTAQVAHQTDQALRAGATGIVVAERELDQSWTAKPLP